MSEAFQETVDAYRSRFCQLDGTLAERLSQLRPASAAHSESWADALLYGLKAGENLAKVFDGIGLDSGRFFRYKGAEFNEVEFHKTINAMKAYLDAHYEPIEIPDLNITCENKTDVQALAVQIMKQPDRLMRQTADKARKEFNKLLTDKPLYDSLSDMDPDMRDLITAVCWLLAGVDHHFFSEEEARNAAVQLGVMVSVSREAVRQAANAFDAVEYRSHYNDIADLPFYLALLIGFMLGAAAVVNWFLPLAEKLALVYLAETLGWIFVFLAVTAVTAGLICVPLYQLLKRYPEEDRAARRISKESAKRAKEILRQIEDELEPTEDAQISVPSVAADEDSYVCV